MLEKLIHKSLNLIFSQTAKDTYLIFGANVFTSFLAFIYTIFLARVFSPSDLGIFSAVYAFILLISDISDIGIGASLSRFLPPLYNSSKEKEATSFIKTAFLFQIKVAFFIFVLVMIFSTFLAQHILREDSYSYLFKVAAFGIFGTILMVFATYTLSAQKKFKKVALINSSSTISKLFFILIFYVLGYLNIFWTTVTFAFSSYLAYFLSLFFIPLKFLKEKEEKGSLKKLLSYSIFLGLSKVFSAVSGRLDALMLIPLSSAFEAGIYSAAFKIIYLYILLAGSFSMVVAPRLSSFSSYTEAVNYLKKIILVVLVILFSMVIMYFIAPWFVIFVLTDKYTLSVTVFRALLIPMAFFTMTIPPVNFLLYTLKKPQVSTFNTFIQLLVIFIGNSLFIPVYGRFGPVVSLTIAYLFTFLSATFFAFYFYKTRLNV